MKSWRQLVFVSILFSLTAQAQNIQLSGQFRERSEFDAKSFIVGQSPDVFHLLRSRLRVDASLNDDVTVAFEFQDARTYGWSGTTFNVGASAFDLRQGFVQVQHICGSPFGFKLGRQALVYANERFLGAIDWNNFSQTFDAGVLQVRKNDLSLDIIGAAIVRNLHTAKKYNRDVFLTGAWAAWKPSTIKSTLQGFYFYDNPKNTYQEKYRHTTGIYASGAYSGVDFEVDGAYQFGDNIGASPSGRDVPIAANTVGIRIGYTFPGEAKLRVGVGFDRLSGDDPKDTSKCGEFHTLYATNHRYYGFMDYFTDIPTQAQELGLQDIIVQISAIPIPGVKLAADLHLFSTVTDPADLFPEGTPKPANISKTIGMEVDLTAAWKIADAVGMTAGFSIFDGERDRYLILLRGRKTTKWAYLMATVNF